MKDADKKYQVEKVLAAELAAVTAKEDHYDVKHHVLSENARLKIRAIHRPKLN